MKPLCRLALLSLSALGAAPALAGGLYLYEAANADVGLANAGSAARAQDASTILGNPAGMTHLDGDVLTGGLQVLAGQSKYQLANDARIVGASPGNVLEPFPAASLFWSHSVDQRLKVGLGIFGNFGSALHFGDWAASGLVKDAALTALTIQPTMAYRLDEHWSLGAGLGVNYGLFALKRNTAFGEEKDNDHDWAINGRLGVMFDVDQGTRLGLMYASKTKYSFDVQPTIAFAHTFQPIPSGPSLTVTRDFTLPISGLVNTPQQLMFSAFHTLTPQWSVMGNLGWQDWSAYSNSTVAVAGRELAGSDRLQDTWHAALGAQYQANARWRFDGGIAYDTSFYKNQNDGSLTMPSGAAWRFGLGAQYQVDPKSTIGTGFEYLRMQGSGVQSALLGGSYDTGHLYFLTAYYTHRF